MPATPPPHNRRPTLFQTLFTPLITLIMALFLAQLLTFVPRSIVLMPTLPPTMLPLEQFHAPEYFPNESRTYRWTRQTSRMHLPNPGGTVILRLTMAAGGDRTIPITIRTPATQATFPVRPDLRRYALLLPPSPRERIPVTFQSPTQHVDHRTLGVMVADVSVAGGGALPLVPMVALLIATIGITALQWRSTPAPYPPSLINTPMLMLTVALQLVMLLWYAYGGWRVALFSPLLLVMGGAGIVAALLDGPWLAGRRARACLPPPSPPIRHDWLWLLLCVSCWLFIRVVWLTAPDPVGDMYLASRRMALLTQDGLAGSYRYDGDYMPLRLYLLTITGHIGHALGTSFARPLAPLTMLLIKLPSLLADLTLMIMIYAWSRRWHPPRYATMITLLSALAPPIWINVAWWGQVDALLLLPLVAAVLLLHRANGLWSWICWTIALLIKPQAIVFAPLLFITTLILHGSKGILRGGIISLLFFAIGCAPLVAAGQAPWLMQAYLGSVGRFPKLTAGAYNLWYLVTCGASGDDTGQGIGMLSFRLIGLVLVGSVALLVGAALLLRVTPYRMTLGAAVLALAFFVLPTQIHERYLILPLVFLVLTITCAPRLALPYALLAISATINIFGTLDGFLRPVPSALATYVPWLPFVLAILNALILIILLIALFFPCSCNCPEQQPHG